MSDRLLEWPEPNDRLIHGSSGKSVGAHGPLRIEHHLELFGCDSSLGQGHRGGIGQDQAGEGAEVQGRRLGIAPIIERHDPEFRFGNLIRGSDVIGQLEYRRLSYANKIDLLRGHDVVEDHPADAASSTEEEDAERANDQPDRGDACRHVSHQRAIVGIVCDRCVCRRPLLRLSRSC
jgi:hypothetical protein